jgi:hypothetical protein
MRNLLILAAAAASLAACHNRSQDEVGAAPDRGSDSTTAVTHVIDSTRTGPPGVSGRTGTATVTSDSVGIDSASTQRQSETGAAGVTDSTATTSGAATDTTTLNAAPQDTLGPRNPGTGRDSTLGDSTGMNPSSQDSSAAK